jgi:hypothetical protein
MTRRTALLALGVLPISLHPFSALAQGADPGAPKWYLLKGGTLLDSAGKTRPSTDIAIKDGIVAAIGAMLVSLALALVLLLYLFKKLFGAFRTARQN